MSLSLSTLFSSSGSFSGAGGLTSGNISDLTGNYTPIYDDELYTVTDPAASWLWTADIKCPANIGALNRVLLADFMVPFMSFNAEQRFRGGFVYNFPKFMNISGPASITFHETQDFQVIEYLLRWMNAVCDYGGNYSLPIHYMGSIMLTMFDGTGIPSFQYELLNVWPERPTDWNLGYSSTLLQTSMSFSVSRGQVTYISSTLLDSPIANMFNPYSGLKNLSPTNISNAAISLGRAGLTSLI